MTSGWDAFSAELGHQSMHLCAAEPVPGLDLLAFDEQAGRAVVAQVDRRRSRAPRSAVR